MKKKIGIVFSLLILGYMLAGLFLLLFSYTQVDLGLTLSQASVVQDVQKAFQHIGFYNRSLSTALFSTLTVYMFFLYAIVILATLKKQLTTKQFWVIQLVLSVILLFSYSASFSYDIFNYIFTAKTAILYKVNPYEVTPLQFSGIDSMLSFMRWTHLSSAYTPLWIILSLPSLLLSFGSLLLAIWMMKIFPIAGFLIATWCIGRIMQQYEPKKSLVAMALFAFNPVNFIEILVSGHNDSIMMAFSLCAFLLFLQKKRLSSFFLLSLSIGLKFMTIFLLPLSIIGWTRWRALLLMCLGLGVVLMQREFLPWYFLWILPFGALFPSNRYMIAIIFCLSLGFVLRYVPLFYFGSYDQPIVSTQQSILNISVAMGIVSSVFLFVYQKLRAR